ncbi:MAG TPA: hypothetical protein VLC53_00465, partial [Myxococcota bacterium]|nr:hypothetical protein [Myxococcota bacterium]
VNDRVAAVAWHDLMPRVMARVAAEAAHCLRPARPAPQPDCASGAGLGRVPDAALASAGGGCTARPGDPAWWPHWRPYALYALGGPEGLAIADEDGRAVAHGHSLAVMVTERPGDCAVGRIECAPAGCASVTRRARSAPPFDAVFALP